MKKEIFADTLAESLGSLEVYVKKEDCPKPVTTREIEEFGTGQKKEQAVCYCKLHSIHRHSPCPHFQDIKEVQRQKRKRIKVFCSALEQ